MEWSYGFLVLLGTLVTLLAGAFLFPVPVQVVSPVPGRLCLAASIAFPSCCRQGQETLRDHVEHSTGGSLALSSLVSGATLTVPWPTDGDPHEKQLCLFPFLLWKILSFFLSHFFFYRGKNYIA